MKNLTTEDKLALIYSQQLAEKKKKELFRRRLLLFLRLSSIVLAIIFISSTSLTSELGSGVTASRVGLRRLGAPIFLALACIWLPNWMLDRNRSSTGSGLYPRSPTLLLAGFAWLIMLSVTVVVVTQRT